MEFWQYGKSRKQKEVEEWASGMLLGKVSKSKILLTHSVTKSQSNEAQLKWTGQFLGEISKQADDFYRADMGLGGREKES